MPRRTAYPQSEIQRIFPDETILWIGKPSLLSFLINEPTRWNSWINHVIGASVILLSACLISARRDVGFGQVFIAAILLAITIRLLIKTLQAVITVYVITNQRLIIFMLPIFDLFDSLQNYSAAQIRYLQTKIDRQGNGHLWFREIELIEHGEDGEFVRIVRIGFWGIKDVATVESLMRNQFNIPST
jgi:hypothetical protein